MEAKICVKESIATDQASKGGTECTGHLCSRISVTE